MKKFILALISASLPTVVSAQTNIRVCTTSCEFNNSQLQQALDTAIATAGLVHVITEVGFVYEGTFILKHKADAVSAATRPVLRSGVSSTGTIHPNSYFPAVDVRVCPSGFVELGAVAAENYDCSTRSPFDTSRFSKIRPINNNEPALTLADSGAGAPADWWEIRWLELIPNAYAGNALLRLANSSASLEAHIPDNCLVDQIVLRGDPFVGQFRGVQLECNNATITNSHMYDVKSTGEGQVIWANTSRGPITIKNNFISGGAEGILTGGGGTMGVTNKTVLGSPAPTSSVMTLNSVQDLWVGQNVLITVGGVQQSTVITNIAGTQVTVNPALTTAPDVPGAFRYSILIEDLLVEQNIITAPYSWYTDITILPVVANVQLTASTTGGTLATGTYGCRVTARYTGGTGSFITSKASPEVTVAVTGPTGSVGVTWDPIVGKGVTAYRVYCRNTGVAYSNYDTAPSFPATSYTYDNPGANSGTPPETGSDWQQKNRFELKQVKGAIVQGNIIRHSWPPDQTGPCIVLTATMQNREAPSAVVQDVTFRYNYVYRCQAAIVSSGRDAYFDVIFGGEHESGRSGNFNIHDNVFALLGNMTAVAGGGGSRPGFSFSQGGGDRQFPTRSHYDVTFNHNTTHSIGNNQSSMMMFDMWDSTAAAISPIPNLKLTNSIMYSGQEPRTILIVHTGGSFAADGDLSIVMGTGSLFTENAFPGAICGDILGGTLITCPTVTEIETDTFTGPLTTVELADFVVKSTSPYFNAGTDSKSYGADISLIQPFYTVAWAGSGSTPDPDPDPPPPDPVEPDDLIPVLTVAQVGVSATYRATVTANATIRRVDFFLNRAYMGTRTFAPWALNIGLKTGTNTITCQVTDTFGNVQTVEVSVVR